MYNLHAGVGAVPCPAHIDLVPASRDKESDMLRARKGQRPDLAPFRSCSHAPAGEDARRISHLATTTPSLRSQLRHSWLRWALPGFVGLRISHLASHISHRPRVSNLTSHPRPLIPATNTFRYKMQTINLYRANRSRRRPGAA